MLLDEPSNKLPKTEMTVVCPEYIHLFQSPIDSFMQMCTLDMWDIIVTKTNHYAEQHLKMQKKKKRLIAGYKWHSVSLEDIMTYFGLLINGMLYPQTGQRFHDS